MAAAVKVKVKLTAEEKIAALKKKIEQVKALDDKQKVRELSDVVRHSSAAETRKKILIGAFIQSHIADLKTLSVNKILFVDSLKRPDDRALFGLPPLPTTAPADAAPDTSDPKLPLPLISSEDFFLNIKPADEEKVKQLGAKWSKEKNKWYVPAGQNGRPFMRFQMG